MTSALTKAPVWYVYCETHRRRLQSTGSSTTMRSPVKQREKISCVRVTCGVQVMTMALVQPFSSDFSLRYRASPCVVNGDGVSHVTA